MFVGLGIFFSKFNYFVIWKLYTIFPHDNPLARKSLRFKKRFAKLSGS